jgi:hypothetical protein
MLIPGSQKVIERKIREAQQRGEFENLPGKGKPLELEDDRNIPEDLRLAYKVLKNADCIPPEVQLRKEIRQMKDMLDSIPDEKEKYLQIRRINYKINKLNALGHNSALFEEKEIYYKKIVDKLGEK